MIKIIFKILGALAALAAVVYVSAGLILEEWNPVKWKPAAKTLFSVSSEQDKPHEEQDKQDKPSDPNEPSTPTTPTDPSKPSEQEKPTESITAEAQAYIDEINAVLDSLDTINYDSNSLLGITFKYQKLSDSDLQTKEVQAAKEAYTLLSESLIYDGYWWAPLDVRKQAAEIMIAAGIRAESAVPTESIPDPAAVPLTREAQTYIDAVNAALDAKDVKQYHLLNIISARQEIRASDLERADVQAADYAGNIIVNNSKLISGVNYSLPIDARREAAEIMIAAGLRTNISWVE